MLLIDQEFLQKHLLNCTIQKTMSRITVQGIDSQTHKYQKFVHLSLYLSGILNEKTVIVHIRHNIHLVDHL